eukprot:5841065-Amphidinium_carterae.1
MHENARSYDDNNNDDNNNDDRVCWQGSASKPAMDQTITRLALPKELVRMSGLGACGSRLLVLLKDCTFWGDPHIHSFDQMSFSDTHE